jgi:hypothetical protein
MPPCGLGRRVSEEILTGEIGWAAPLTEVDLVIAPGFAFAGLAIECNYHLATSAYYCGASKMLEIW